MGILFSLSAMDFNKQKQHLKKETSKTIHALVQTKKSSTEILNILESQGNHPLTETEKIQFHMAYQLWQLMFDSGDTVKKN